MEDEIPLLKEPSSDSDVEVLQDVSLTPIEALSVPFSNSENAAAFVPSVTESVSFETETNQNAGLSILQSTSSATKGKKDADSTMTQSTSPSTESIQDATPSHLSTAETNQDAGPATSSAVLSNQVYGPSTSSVILRNPDAGPPAYSAILPNQVVGPSTSSAILRNPDASPPVYSAVLPNQVVGPSASSAILRNPDAGPSVSSAILSIQNVLTSSTETNGTNELMLSGQYIRRNINHEGASTLDDEQPTENDPLLPKDPPYYHDIIPIFESGSHIPSPPPAVLRSLFCCFFGSYYLYYARKIRNSRFMLIPLVAFLAIPLSALIMGFKYYFSSCSGSPRTPLLLCIAGGLGLLLNSLRIVTVISRKFDHLGVCEPPRILVESSALLLFCLFIVEIIAFFLNAAVFDDPSHPLYCPESLHEYIFYVNFVVLAIGILALLIHLPTTPMNDLKRYVEEAAAAATLRQQQNVDPVADDPGLPEYTPWTKPRRRRSQHHRSRVNAHHDSRGRFDEAGIEISYTTSEETTAGGETVGGRNVRVHWLDQASAASVCTRSDSWDEEYNTRRPMRGRMENQSPIGWQRFLQEGNIVVTVDNRCGREEGAVGGNIGGGAVSGDIGEGVVGGDIEDRTMSGDIEDCTMSGDIKGDTAWGPIRSRMWNQRFLPEYNVVGAVDSPCGHEGAVCEDIQEGAVGGDIGDGAECGEIRTHQWEEGESLDTPPRNRSSTYTIHQGEENPSRDFAGPSRGDEDDGLRSQRMEESSIHGARPKTRETKEGGTKPKRKGRAPDPPKIESTETEILNEGTVETDDLGTNWHEYGARPKTKVIAECIPKITVDSVRRNESTEEADKILRNKEVAEIDAFGNQGNVGNEGGARPKTVEDAEREARPKQEENTDEKLKEGTVTDTGDKVKERPGVTVEEVTTGGAAPKCEESTERDVSPQISENIESSDSENWKEKSEYDDILE